MKFLLYLSWQGEQFSMKLDKGSRGFGFSLVAAPTFSSDVSDYTELVVIYTFISRLIFDMLGSLVGPRNFYQDNKPW